MTGFERVKKFRRWRGGEGEELFEIGGRVSETAGDEVFVSAGDIYNVLLDARIGQSDLTVFRSICWVWWIQDVGGELNEGFESLCCLLFARLWKDLSIEQPMEGEFVCDARIEGQRRRVSLTRCRRTVSWR